MFELNDYSVDNDELPKPKGFKILNIEVRKGSEASKKNA